MKVLSFILFAVIALLSVLLYRLRESEAALRENLTKLSLPPVLETTPRLTASAPPLQSVAPKLSEPATKQTPALSALDERLANFLSGNSIIDAVMTTRTKWSHFYRNEHLISKLELSREQRARLRELLAAKATAENDVREIALREKLTREQRTASLNDVARRTEAEVESLIGSEGYTAYRQAVAEAGFRNGLVKTGELHGCFIESDAPLSSEQFERLTSILYRESEALKDQPNTLNTQMLFQDKVFSRTETILSPQQRAALARYFELDRNIGEELVKLGK